MLTNPLLWGFLLVLACAFYAFVGWLGAMVATEALPPPDNRQRPSDISIRAAAEILDVRVGATDDEVKAAARKLLPRAPGDCLPDGRLRIDIMNQVLQAQYLLIDTNAFDANPPFEASTLLRYWDYRAGALGRLWGRIAPPPAVQRLRMQATTEQPA